MPRRRAGRRSPARWSSRRAARSNRRSAWCSSTRAPGGCTAAKPLIFRRFDRMRIAILDPAAGISGDMTLGALLSAGAPAAWLEELPRRLDLPDVLDTVGGIEGFAQLGVEAVYNLPVAVGSGWVDAAHGRLPVPAPATAILLEGVELAGDPGPVEGEATTPTGAALVRVLSSGPPP